MVNTTETNGAAGYIPEDRALGSLEAAARRCRGCSLFQDATQTVFGHGRPGASIMLVGEQPGDQEDRAGLPFVGPAGRLLVRALDDAEIDPALTYQTNAVKHFKFTRKGGKRRIHEKPSRTEVVAWPALAHCRDRGGAAAGDRVPRRDCGAIASGTGISGVRSAWSGYAAALSDRCAVST